MRRLLAALACSAALGAGAQAHWYAQFDNDLGFETDRWYSSGFRASAVQERDGRYWELGVLHEIYTPDAKGFKPGAVDRMPTARLLLVAARHERSAELWQTLELDAGVRGPSAGGRAITRAVHHIVHARDIDWSRQDRDRIDVQAVVSRTQAAAMAGVNYNYGAVLGNELAFAHAGAEYRIGTRGANAPSTGVVRFAASPPRFDTHLDGCWSLFVAASARFVMQNKMLAQGYDFFSQPPTRRRAVARGTLGYSWAWPWGMVTAAVVHESKEFAEQSRGHTFGSIAGYVDF